ncbi:hypothetical protein LJB95_00960 [Paludibacteraceae bacterium OttesenSCG-928-F17]|nr:hypothetical protein [Paludibacteraceae bacterium OttesenSCG-928-F17]
MEALKRKPDLSVRRSMTLPDGTKIEVVGVTARTSMELVNNKKMPDAERGMRMTAAKIRINGQPVVYEDLLDCFTDDELTEIAEFVNPPEDDEKNG